MNPQITTPSMTFRDLHIGDTFDFAEPDISSFFKRCRKVSASCYVAVNDNGHDDRFHGTMRAHSMHAPVYHVERQP